MKIFNMLMRFFRRVLLAELVIFALAGLVTSLIIWRWSVASVYWGHVLGEVLLWLGGGAIFTGVAGAFLMWTGWIHSPTLWGVQWHHIPLRLDPTKYLEQPDRPLLTLPVTRVAAGVLAITLGILIRTLF